MPSYVTLINWTDQGVKNFKDSVEQYQRLFETYSRHPSIVIYVLSNELPVSGTRVRDVSKPRGAKAGTVHIRHERVFKVRPARGDRIGAPAHDSA